MSDLSLRLQQAASQLPVSSYFDEALLQRELAEILGYSSIHINRAVRDLRDRKLVR